MHDFVRGTNNAVKVCQSFFVHLIAVEQVGIVAKVSEKPM